MLMHLKNIPLGGRLIDNTVFTLLDAFSDPAFLIDPSGIILDANAACVARIGKHSDTFPGTNLFDLQTSGVHIPELAAGLREKCEEVLRTGDRLTFEKKGNGNTFRYTITPTCSTNGKITHLFIVVQTPIEHRIEPEEQKELEIDKIIPEAIPCSIVIMNAGGRVLWLNQYAKDIIADNPDDNMLGLDAFKTIHPDDRASAMEIFRNILDTGVEGAVEVRRTDHDGTDFTWRIVHGRRITIDDKPCVLAVGIDITERKRTEDKLIENQKRFRQALEATHAGVWEWDLRTGENIWSDEIWELYGCERGKAQPSFDLWASSVHPDDRLTAIQVAIDAAKKGIELNNEFRVLRTDGTVRWLMSRGMPLFDDKGEAVQYLGTSIDITERKQTENALKENSIRLSQALEAARAGIWEWNLKTGENIWSDEIWSLFGLKRGRRSPSFELWENSIHPEDLKMALSAVTHAVEQEIEMNLEYRVIYPDGSVHWLMARGKPFRDNEGIADRYIGTIIDITERKRIEDERQKLLESKAGINAALEICHIGWWEIDLQNNTVLRSLEHERIFGYDSLRPEWTYQMFLEHIVPDDRAEVDRRYQESTATLSEWNIECRIRRTDGEIRWIWAVGGYQFDRTGRAARMSGLIQDITERRRKEEESANLQAQLQQSQKMELVGQLAGGIAHDFNNILTAILGNTELLLGKIDDTHPFSENLDDIRNSVKRSADLVRQLLAFARKENVNPKTMQLDDAVFNLQPMLRRLIPENIHFDWRLNSDKAKVSIDPSQLDQIVTNLCINARDAISGSGTITIETSTDHVIRNDFAVGDHRHVTGDYIRFSVTDTGSGIDPKTLPHIFEPFFTTKEIGKGTGLGLSTLYGIVKQNNGYIDCRSIPGKGSTFNVYLPEVENVRSEEMKKEAETLVEHSYGTILLVEDEPYILKILKEILEDKGYSVLVASNAEWAMRIAQKFMNHISLLVTDIMLPNMNGIELSNMLHADNPELKVIFMSGYAPDEFSQHQTFEQGVDFIQKPFTIENFTRIVSNTLSTSATSQAT
jgi:PAS domain S-box-containing protein